jgi:hypothetical protein
MPPSPFARSTRGTLAALTVAIAGVLVLDATTIVAAPRVSTPAPAANGSLPLIKSKLRLISWSHQTWLVFPNSAKGPDGPNTLSDSTKAVHVDAKGRLHLRITKVAGKWRGAQLESLTGVNYGTYRWVTSSPLGNLAKPIVLGMFIYRPSQVRYTNEIDLEDSRSLIGLGYPRDAQYVVQPYFKGNHIHRYAIRRKYRTVTQQFNWQPGKVSFVTRVGSAASGHKLSQFAYSGPDVPQTANEHVYINLHLHSKHPHPGPGSRSVVINSYSFAGH